MKKSVLIGIVVFALIVVIGVVYLILVRESNCSFDNVEECDRSCELSEDCHVSGTSCVNKNEEMYVPNDIIFDFFVIGCECINNQCEDLPSIPTA